MKDGISGRMQPQLVSLCYSNLCSKNGELFLFFFFFFPQLVESTFEFNVKLYCPVAVYAYFSRLEADLC